MKRIEKYELIERYLLDRLNEAEKADFELRLKSDLEFATEVEMHRTLQQLLIDHSLLEVKDTLNDIRLHDILRKLQYKKLYKGLLIVGFCAFILTISLILLNRRDIAVRSASEAHKASEAFSDSVPVKSVRVQTPVISVPVTQKQNKGSEKNMINGKPEPLNTISDVSGEKEKIIPTDVMKQPVSVTIENSKSEEPLMNSVDTLEADIIGMPCKIIARYSVTPSCNNNTTGVIEVYENSISGGTAPYRVLLNGEYSQSMVYSNLNPASYRLEIKDAAGCISEVAIITVSAVNCFPKDTRFSPVYEIWEMPLEPGRSGIITLYNKSGQIVYQLKFNGLNAETWNGNDLKNEVLPRGVYPFIIRYDNGQVFEGTVTIVR